MIYSNALLDILDQEIKFHEDNKSIAPDKSNDWKDGFIAGLEHIKCNILPVIKVEEN